MNQIKNDPQTGLDYIDFDGHRRVLGSIPSGGKMKAMLPNYTAAGNPIFPRAEWKTFSRRGRFDSADWIYDQNGFGSCVGNGWAGALRRLRVLLGYLDVKLSPAFLYSLINGGSDNGAVISDAISALKQTGTCSYATVGESPIYTRQMPAAAKTEAARFRLEDAYHCNSYDEVVSALLTGLFIPVYGYQVGNNFEQFDKFGVGGHARGPGNHCNHADGVVLLSDGRWVLDDVNSWNYKWGPFSNGRVYLDEQHLFGGGDQPDCCVIRIATVDPNDPGSPTGKP